MLGYRNMMDFADTLPKARNHPSTDTLRISLKRAPGDIISDISNITTIL